MPEKSPVRGARRYVTLVLIGLLAGTFSGLFGVGGGTIIVPMLVMLLGFGQRLAVGTSVAAILPAALSGAISYGVREQVNLWAALFLAVGSIVGAAIGARLLHKLNVTLLRWIFVVFVLVSAVMMFYVVPSREAHLEITWISGSILILVGLVVGILSGLIGIGGGVVVVPVLMMGFGASDVVARGTSLAMMVPTSLTGLVANVRASNIDLAAAATIGLVAFASAPLGSFLANYIDPVVGNILFALFLLFIAGQMALRTWRAQRK